MVNKENN
jgi:hypothetical protein